MRIARPLADRFHEKYIPEPMSGCWLWTACTATNGYARITVAGVSRGGHRVAYELYRGPIPENMQVLHTCDVRCCVNPLHLFLGTQADNITDMINKGRDRCLKGENHGSAKLTERQVLDIRAATGFQREIASRYSITQTLVSYIKNRKAWAHI